MPHRQTSRQSATIRKCREQADWLRPKSIGEANFFCDWTEENLQRLVKLARLQPAQIP